MSVRRSAAADRALTVHPQPFIRNRSSLGSPASPRLLVPQAAAAARTHGAARARARKLGRGGRHPRERDRERLCPASVLSVVVAAYTCEDDRRVARDRDVANYIRASARARALLHASVFLAYHRRTGGSSVIALGKDRGGRYMHLYVCVCVVLSPVVFGRCPLVAPRRFFLSS